MLDVTPARVAAAETLPEFWPERPAPKVARAWWIPWPVAIFLVPLLWLMPKRMGPHFAAVRWPGVIIGHLAWLIYGIGCIDLAYWAPHYGWVAWLTGRAPGQADPTLWPPPSAWDIFRAPLALEAVWLSQVIGSIEQYLLAWGVVLGYEVVLVGIGLLLTPYVSVGERTGRLVARCVKMTMWAASSAVVLGFALQAVVLFTPKPADVLSYAILVCAAYMVWVLWMGRRSADHYWGPAEGPAWERRRPACEACGYILTGLTAADRCPECGQAVAESLPSRRGAMPCSTARGLGRLPTIFQTAGRVLVGRRHLERLAVHEGFGGARSFAILVALLASGVAAPLVGPAIAAHWFQSEYVQGSLDPLTVTLAAWAALTALTLAVNGAVAAGTRAVSRLPLQPRAAVAFLHAAWYPVLGLVLALGGVAGVQLLEPTMSETETLTWTGVIIVVVVLFAYLVTKATASLLGTLRKARWANA